MTRVAMIVLAASLPAMAAGSAAVKADEPAADYIPGKWYHAIGSSAFVAVCPDKGAWAATYGLVTAKPMADWHRFGCIDVEFRARVQLISADGIANDALVRIAGPNGKPVLGAHGDTWYVAYEDLSIILLPPEAEAANDPYRIRQMEPPQ